jgi:DNA (cytosine-5)-methyltransferase 1
MLNGLSLFSGIGGIDVALSGYVRPIAYCEIDPYCQGILLSRMANGSISKAPIWDDIKTLQAIPPFSMFVDIIYGGFPCQGISVAGRGTGLADERSGLFWEIIRLAKEIKPKFIFLENVPAITTRGGLQVVRAIAEMGYDCRWCVISAASIGALHRRERWFLLAYSNSSRLQEKGAELFSTGIEQFSRGAIDIGWPSTDTNCNGRWIQQEQGMGQKETNTHHSSSFNDFWKDTEPPVYGVAHGIPNRVDRIKGLGNAVVPEQAKEAFEILMGLK